MVTKKKAPEEAARQDGQASGTKRKSGKADSKANGKAAAAAAATAAAAAATAPGARMTPPKHGVKVRMYRVGLGDCFLLAFPHKGGGRDVFYLMIDCGVFKGTTKEFNAPWIDTIVQDIRDATGGRLDVLVVTHEHWDHVSAFSEQQSQQRFHDDIQLGALWLAWTEDESLPLAKQLASGRRAALTALTHAFQKMQGMGIDSENRKLVGTVLDFFGGVSEADAAEGGQGLAAVFAAKSQGTADVMKWLKTKYGEGKTKFLHPGGEPLELPGVPDVRLYILGPPEDAALIKRYNPSAKLADEVYHKSMAAALEASFFAAFGVVPSHKGELPDADDVEQARRMSLPFEKYYQIPEDAVKNMQAGDGGGTKSDVEFLDKHYYQGEPWRCIEADWLEASGAFALQLDSATNNTSLAFALEVGPPGAGKVLLFPGDAQVGNWESWFGKVTVGKQTLGKDMVWTAGGKSVTAKDLLHRTVLYKVGHHGSHNATLKKQGLELMGRADGAGEFMALLPVNEHVARRLAGYGEMPLMSLVKELAIRTHGRIARSDENDKPDPVSEDGLKSTLRAIPGVPAPDPTFVTRGQTKDKKELFFELTIAPPP